MELPTTEDRCDGQSHPIYSAPFEITFPSRATGCHCQLPPTLCLASSLVKIRVEYAIDMSLRYYVLGRVKRTKTVKRELPFWSEPSMLLSKALTVGYLPAGELCSKIGEKLREADKTCLVNPNWVPPYTPSLELAVELPSPPVLVTCRPTSIRLVFYTPPELLDGDNIYIRSVVIQLKSSVAALVGTISGSWTETSHCWSSSGRIHLDKERFELDSGAWSNCIVSNALPTCSSCALSLTHAVAVIAGISRGEDENIKVHFAQLRQHLGQENNANEMTVSPNIARCPCHGSTAKLQPRCFAPGRDSYDFPSRATSGRS